MQSVSKITIFGLKMMVKSGLEKIFLKSLHAIFVTEFVVLGKHFPIYEVRENNFPQGGISKMFFVDPKLYFFTDSILSIKMMVE